MKITKWQFKEALTAAYEAGFDGGRVQQYSPTDVVKRIAKREAKHAKARKLTLRESLFDGFLVKENDNEA